MHIIAGSMRGMRIHTLDGTKVRPTKSSMREAVFNILGQDLNGVSFMDLCAGSGSMGLEALSRGAHPVHFIEPDYKAGLILRKNLESAGRRLNSKPPRFCSETFMSYMRRGEQADIVYFDPPYELYLKKNVAELGLDEFVKPYGTLLLEHDTKCMKDAPETIGRLDLFKTRKYGKSLLSIYREREKEVIDSQEE